MPTMPYVIGVKLLQSDSTARSGATIKITNDRTGDTQTATTNQFGQSVFDGANFTQGYIVGDVITVEKNVNATDFEFYVTANGSESNPTWVQVANETRTQIVPSTARFKLDLTKNPGGKQVIVTLN